MQAHIHLDETINAEYAVLPGDPGRIDRIIPFLEDVKHVCFNREYRSITGTYKGIRILCMSTGMGGVSASIAAEELNNIGVTTMIRTGSCGALSPDLKTGDLVISSGCVRDDGTSAAYIRRSYPAVPDTDVLFAMISAARNLGIPHHVGITRSHESFYAEAEIAQEEYWKNQNVLCDDMETASLFVVASLRGMRCGSVLNVVAACGENSAEGVESYSCGSDSAASAGERNEILLALETIARLEGK